MRKTCTLLFLAMAASAAACGGGEREAEPLTPAAQVQGSNVRSAADSIASARCDRSQRCNHIGQGGEYSDREHCLSVARPKAEEQLGVCPRGVDQEDLEGGQGGHGTMAPKGACGEQMPQA